MPPVFAHGAMRLYLLYLLEDRQKHGYEIIRALSDRFGGTYSPSAGSVYPRLSKLEEEGLVATRRDGRRTLYGLTDAGRRELAARRVELADIDADISASVTRLAETLSSEIRDNMRSLRADLAATAERFTGARFTAARHAGQTPPAAGHPGHTPPTAGHPGQTPPGADAPDLAPSASAETSAPAPSAEPLQGPPRPPGRFAAPPTPGEPAASPQGASLRSLRELEHQLDDFRVQLRADLRTGVGRHGLDEAAYATIKAVLEQAKASIRSVLR